MLSFFFCATEKTKNSPFGFEGAEKIRGTVTKFPDPDVTC